ncbi:MAG TPA: hypothetical protein VFZ75_10100 [Actinomycetota bacterium]|nr:hypothetical protein [Actinomycetota bacterium]
MEAEGSPTVASSGGPGAQLDRIEVAVDAGDIDLRRLGFWRVVRLIKLDDELIERHAEQVGRIDAKAFREHFPILVPVWLGNAILGLLILVGILAIAFAVGAGPIALDDPGPTAAGWSLLVAAAAWMVGLHSSAHWLIGRAVGIRFRTYFAAFPPPPLPGLKTDYATYLRAGPTARAWMHGSGAVATKLAPFLALAFAPAAGAPAWTVIVLLVTGVGQIATDVFVSTKASDWKKVRRELAVARARAGG